MEKVAMEALVCGLGLVWFKVCTRKLDYIE